MVDSPCTMKKIITVPEIKPLDQYDVNRAKIRSSVRWLLCKLYGCVENVPVELRDPLYKDQYEQQHLKPAVSMLLLSPETYCKVQALLAQGDTQPVPQPLYTNNSSLIQFLIKKGLTPNVQDLSVTEEDLCSAPIKMKAHLAMIDSLMSLNGKETVGRVKIAADAERMGVLSPWENSLLFWANRLNQKLRENTEEEEEDEEEESSKSHTCTDLQPVQEMSQSSRWYWKLVPHAIAFCLKESGNKPPVIRYRKDKVLSKLTPTFPLVSGVKDLSNGCAVAAVLHYYCPELLPLNDVCLKDTMSVADSLYNLQLIKEFCESSLQSCCFLTVEDMLYAPATLHLNIMSFMAELLDWFEVKKPDFVQPLQPIDLTDVSGLLHCSSPVSGNSNSGSPCFIFKQPFVPISSPVPAENKSWTKKQISRPLSAVTFSIPFGLDSDVDIVMGNPIDSVFRSVSTDSLATGVPSVTSTGMTRVPYSPPEDLSHLVSTSAPLHHSSWNPYTHTAPMGELPTIEEVLQVGYIPTNKDKKKEREKTGRGVVVVKQEPRLCPEGAPAGFFLHSPGEDCPQLSSSAPSHTENFYRLEQSDNQRQGRRECRKSGRNSEMSRDDDSVLRDGSVDSSEVSDDACRNAPGNLRPSNGHRGNNSISNSPRMTNFAERRDSRRRHPSALGEESPARTPTTPGAHHMPSTPAGLSCQQDSLGPRGPEPGSEAWELGARLEEKRKSIEAQKKRIEAIFAKHRQRLGKTAFLKLQKEQGEGASQDNLTLEEHLTCVEEQLKEEEEKEQIEKASEKEKDKPPVSYPTRLEKQVTFAIESKKGPENEQESEKKGDTVIVECNEVVQKLSEALQSLQKDMLKLTEQQQKLMSNQGPQNILKTYKTKTPPHTPTKTPPKTPTKTSTRTTSKACMIPEASNPFSPSRPSHTLHSLTSPKISASCPAPRTKNYISSSPRSPKCHSRPQHPRHPRPSELKFPPLNRVLMPTQNVDTLPHLRRVSPSKCQVQTSSSFRIGGPKTPHDYPQPTQQPQLDESTSDTGSSETPTQFSLELDQEDVATVEGLPVLQQPKQYYTRAVGGSSSGAPSECSFDSETLSMSAAFSTVADDERGAEKPCGLNDASLSSPGGPDGGSDEPTDEGQEFSSDSMSDRTESAVEPASELAEESLSHTEILNLGAEVRHLPEQESGTKDDDTKQTVEQQGDQSEAGMRGAIGFCVQDEIHSEGEMAQRKALLLERQHKRAEVMKRRRQWHEQERENSLAAADNKMALSTNTPPDGNTSPSPTPPTTPARRGDFTKGEYALRQQLRIMDDLDKALKQKTVNPVTHSTKKARSRPRSMTREETKLSLSPAKGVPGCSLTKVYSHSSLNLAVTNDSGSNGSESPKKSSSNRPGSPSLCRTPSKLASQNGGKDWDSGMFPTPEYTGPKLFKEPSFKSNKFMIHNALSRCCLAGKVNEMQKNKIVEEIEKSPANHFLILFRDSNCQFRGVYTMNPDSGDLVRLAGIGPRTVSSSQVESIYKYSSDRKQFSAIPSKTMGMSVDAFTIPGHLWQGAGGGGGGSRRASITKKTVTSK